MTKIAQQIAHQYTDVNEAAQVAEARAIAKDQIWSGDGYTKYTFDDNSVLIQSGALQYGMDADNAESIHGYAEWLGDEVDVERTEIDRLLEAAEAGGY